MQGGESKSIDDTDIEYVFKQESFFQWAFGVHEPDCYGMIDMTGRATLFIPKLDPSYAVWMGRILPPEFYRDKYEVEDCAFVCDLPDVVKARDPEIIYVLSGINTDSGLAAPEATFPGINAYRVDKGKLHRDMVECRVRKSPREIEVMRYATRLTAEAHKAVMKACRPGMMEYQLEAVFMYHSYFHGGSRQSGYTPICASGPNSAVLHYGHAGAPNNRRMEDGDMVLVDCGAEYHGYDGDLTSTFPVNGKFTQDQRDVYESVLAAVRGVEAAMKPGVLWPDMHRLAYRILLEQLTARGFLKGDVADMIKEHIAALFMPHGLGHLIGLDTHDVGGYPARSGIKRPTEPGIRRLRTGRVLVPGMVITVEPGCYFNSFLLEPALANPAQAKFLVEEKIRRFLNFGGVRIEDNVHITETGIEIFDELPRTCEEIEAFMAK